MTFWYFSKVALSQAAGQSLYGNWALWRKMGSGYGDYLLLECNNPPEADLLMLLFKFVMCRKHSTLHIALYPENNVGCFIFFR